MASLATVTCYGLRKQLVEGLKNIRIIDASWDLETGSKGARENYEKIRIEGTTAFFDIDEICDKNSRYENMLPSPELFQERVGQMGISNSDLLVIYDNNAKYGLFSAPRVWWMFRVFGHKNVSVLNGGFPHWTGCYYPVDEGPPPETTPQNYTATFDKDMVRNIRQIQEHLTSGSAQVVDARSEGRFGGSDPEPRPELPSGHMIGAKNVPYMSLLDPETKLLKEKDELKKVFEAAGVDLSRPMVTTCGSGMTAAVVTLAAKLVGVDAPLYDGSWVEWSQAAPASSRTHPIRNETSSSKSA